VPPELGLDSGHQLARAERLDHVVIGAHPQPANAVGLFAPSGEQNDRHGGRGVATQATTDLDSVHARQHDVQDDQVWRAIAIERDCQSADPVGGRNDAEPLTDQVALEHVDDDRFVVNDQDGWLVVA